MGEVECVKDGKDRNYEKETYKERDIHSRLRERERASIQYDAMMYLFLFPCAASQMDGDHYVPISIVASFNQVNTLYCMLPCSHNASTFIEAFL